MGEKSVSLTRGEKEARIQGYFLWNLDNSARFRWLIMYNYTAFFITAIKF